MKRQTFLFAVMLMTMACLLLGPCVASAVTPGIHFTWPKSTDVLVVGSTVVVYWTLNDMTDLGPLKLNLVENSGTVKCTLETNVNFLHKSASLKIPAGIYNWSTRHKIVARGYENKVVGESEHFMLTVPEIKVSLLKVGAVWKAGVTNMIDWTTMTLPTANARVELVRKSDNKVVQVIVPSLRYTAEGTVNWAPDKTTLSAYNGQEFFIRVWNSSIDSWGDSKSFKLEL